MNDENPAKTATEPTPVILVHGWRPTKEGSTVIEWDKMKQALDKEDISYYEFDYLPATGNPYKYAADLGEFIFDIRASTGYTGKFDIVCHSMGALVTRSYMARGDNCKNIRQWIGIAPVNHGSALADLIDSKGLGYLLVKPLIYLYFQDIGSQGAVAKMRTYDDQTIELNKSGPNHDGIIPEITYQIILGNEVPLKTTSKSTITRITEWLIGNSKEEYASYQSVKQGGFVPTRVMLKENGKRIYRWTADGDGAVANAQSMLNNVTPHIISGVGHTELPKDSAVIDLVVSYCKNYKEN